MHIFWTCGLELEAQLWNLLLVAHLLLVQGEFRLSWVWLWESEVIALGSRKKGRKHKPTSF